MTIYKGRGLCTFLESCPCAMSCLSDFVSEYPIKTLNMIAYIQYATQGNLSLENVHPFHWEMVTSVICGNRCKATIHVSLLLSSPFSCSCFLPHIVGSGLCLCSQRHGAQVFEGWSSNIREDSTSTHLCCYRALRDTDFETVFCAILNALKSEFHPSKSCMQLYWDCVLKLLSVLTRRKKLFLILCSVVARTPFLHIPGLVDTQVLLFGMVYITSSTSRHFIQQHCSMTTTKLTLRKLRCWPITFQY